MTPQEAIRLLRTEQLGDSELLELAKQMGADALERKDLRFVIPKCENCGQYIYGVAVKHVPELSFQNIMCAHSIDPPFCPYCHSLFLAVIIDHEAQTCTLRGPKEEPKE